MNSITRTIYTTTLRLGTVVIDNNVPTVNELEPITVVSTAPLSEKEIHKRLRLYPKATLIEQKFTTQVMSISLDDFIRHAKPTTRPPSQQ